MESFLEKLRLKKKPIRFLFLCSGNICRSPMAEMLFEKLAKERGVGDQIESISGAVIFHNDMIMWETAQVLREEGINDERINKFYPRHISRYPELLEADVILTMEKRHLSAIPKNYLNKSFLLSEFAGCSSNDVSDPYGDFIDTYKEIANEIKYYLNKILDILIEKKILDPKIAK
ncbi:MAG: arsenate reductase/protein-tyrosine-phosphatase family protein [Candidatus Helarchaeota archaeon]